MSSTTASVSTYVDDDFLLRQRGELATAKAAIDGGFRPCRHCRPA